MAGAIALGFARWLEKLRVALCIHRCIRRHTFYAPDRFHSLYSLDFARCKFTEAYRSFPGHAFVARQGGGYFCVVSYRNHIPCTPI